MTDQFRIEWQDRGRPPIVRPDEKYPFGKNLDMRKDKDAPYCKVELPYPTGHKNIGGWLVKCKTCRLSAFISAASRPDDPRSALLNCKVVA